MSYTRMEQWRRDITYLLLSIDPEYFDAYNNDAEFRVSVDMQVAILHSIMKTFHREAQESAQKRADLLATLTNPSDWNVNAFTVIAEPPPRFIKDTNVGHGTTQHRSKRSNREHGQAKSQDAARGRPSPNHSWKGAGGS